MTKKQWLYTFAHTPLNTACLGWDFHPLKILVAEAKRQNAKALAITDHGNLYGALKFFKAWQRSKN